MNDKHIMHSSKSMHADEIIPIDTSKIEYFENVDVSFSTLKSYISMLEERICTLRNLNNRLRNNLGLDYNLPIDVQGGEIEPNRDDYSGALKNLFDLNLTLETELQKYTEIVEKISR